MFGGRRGRGSACTSGLTRTGIVRCGRSWRTRRVGDVSFDAVQPVALGPQVLPPNVAVALPARVPPPPHRPHALGVRSWPARLASSSSARSANTGTSSPGMSPNTLTSSRSMSIMMARPIEIPAESQYRFHVAHFAAVTGTRTIRYTSSWPRPESSLRSILASVPRIEFHHAPPVSTCRHRATCCRCVCDLGVSARICDEAAGVVAVLRIVAVVDGIGGAPIVFRGFSIVGLPWRLGSCWMQRLVPCLGSGRPR